MIMDITYAKAIEQSDALKSIGQKKIYLYNTEFPWHIAGKCEPGSSFRMDMATSARFTGTEKGIEFSWSFDLEPRSANGKGSYEIDVKSCQEVLGKLHGEVLIQFRKYLSDCASKVMAQGQKYQEVADQQFRDAAILRDLVKFNK